MSLTKAERAVINASLEAVSRIIKNSADDAITLKAAQTMLNYDIDVAKYYLDREKYEKPATQKIEHEIKGIHITFESPDSK